MQIWPELWASDRLFVGAPPTVAPNYIEFYVICLDPERKRFWKKGADTIIAIAIRDLFASLFV